MWGGNAVGNAKCTNPMAVIVGETVFTGRCKINEDDCGNRFWC